MLKHISILTIAVVMLISAFINPLIADINLYEVGYTTALEKDTLPVGANSFYVDGEAWYIIDNVNQRILMYQNGRLNKSFKIDYIDNPVDIVVYKDYIYILDDIIESKIYILTKSGQLKDNFNIPDDLINYKNNAWKWFIVRDNLLYLADCSYNEYEVLNDFSSSLNEFSLEKTFSSSINVQFFAKSATLELKSHDQQIKRQDIIFKCLPAGIEPVGYDKENNIYLMVSERSDTANVIIERTIQKYSPQGQLLGIVLLPGIEEFSAHRPVQVLDNGAILYLDVTPVHSKILKLDISKKSYNSTIMSKEINQKAVENEEKLTESFSVMRAPINTKSQAHGVAVNLNSMSWNYTAQNNQTIPSVTRPDWLSSYGTKYGIPYCWGGYDSITTKSDGASWSNFTSAISSNAFAGNINTSGSYKANTAGLDCSGYVAACTGDYFSSKPGTTYWASAGVLNSSSPQYMDIYVKSGSHVLFFNNHLSDMSGISSLESTTSGDDKCKVYSRTWSFLSSYTCRSLW